MSELKFALIFEAMDRISPVAEKIASVTQRMGEQFEKTGAIISRFGERMSLTSQIIANGAEEIQRWANAVIEPAAGMQDAMLRVQATTDLSAAALVNVREQLTTFAESGPGEAADKLAASFARNYEVLGNIAQAVSATTVASKLAYIQHTDTAAAVGLLTEVHTNLGIEAAKAGDMVARTIQTFSIAAPEQYARSVGKLSQLAAASNSSLAEVLAIAAQAGNMMPGRGATAIASMFDEFVKASSEGKTGIDMSGGLFAGLEQLHSKLAGLSKSGELLALKNLGIEADPAMLIYLDHLDEISGKIAKIGDSSGALNSAWSTESGGFIAQSERFAHIMAAVAESFGTPALGTLAATLGTLGDAMQYVGSVAQNHPIIAKWFTLSLAGAGALGIATSRLGSVLGTALSIFGHGYQLMGSAIVRLVPILQTVGETLIANPWVAAAAAIGIAAYEIYQHWDAIAGLAGRVAAVATRMYDAGAGMMKALASGILSEIMVPVHAIEHVAARIGRFVLGHSPPPEGPLRELHRTRIVETIAASMTTAPAIAAIGRVAAAIALTAPIAIGGAAFASIAGPLPRGSAASSAVVINLTVNFNGHAGGNGADFEREARANARTLVDIMYKEIERRERRQF